MADVGTAGALATKGTGNRKEQNVLHENPSSDQPPLIFRVNLTCVSICIKTERCVIHKIVVYNCTRTRTTVGQGPKNVHIRHCFICVKHCFKGIFNYLPELGLNCVSKCKTLVPICSLQLNDN